MRNPSCVPIQRSFSMAVLVVLHVSLGQAQTGKPTVGILPMTVSEGVSADLYAARAYEGQLAQTLSKLGRVTVLDRTQASRVGAEKEQQKGADFIDSKALAQQGRSFGAQLVIAANVDKLALSQGGPETTYYECNLTVSVRIIDVATQEVKASHSISSNASSGGKKGLGGLLNSVVTMHSTPQDAIGAAVKNAEKELLAVFNATWPIRFALVQVESISADSGNVVVLLDGGRALGASVKMAMAVMEAIELNVSGRTVTREKEIGRLEITTLDGDDLSTAAIKSNSRLIAQRIAAGAKLYATIPR